MRFRRQYRVEFFENPNGINGTGLGEGESFLGAVTVTSGGSGFEIFNEVLTGVTASNLATVAATATEYFGGTSFGSTSEFGPATTAIVSLSAIKDTYLDEGNDEYNYGNFTSLMVDEGGGDLGNGRVLLQFDLSTIPAGATITSATLQLNATSNSASFPINVYEVTEDWQEGTGGTGAADWDHRYSPEISTSEWSTPGGTVDDSVIIASLDTGDTGLHFWDITSLAQDWFTGAAANNGLMLASPDTGGETVVYDSRETIHPPQLIISFVLPPNTAPSLDPTVTLSLDNVVQDNGPPSGAVGTLIDDLVDLQGGGGLDNVTDPDFGAQAGIAVTHVESSEGAWYYSTDDGLNWNALGSVGTNSARLLAADSLTRIYFEANPGFSGTIAAAITFQAWDQTSGLNGDLGDTAPGGGTNAFSTAQDVADITVEEVDDIKETVNPIIVDGVVDDSWSLATAHTIDHLIEGAVDDAADLFGSWRSMWDDTYLYTLVEVNDESIVADSGILFQLDDSIELYINPDNSLGSSYDGVNDYALLFRAADGAMLTGPNSETDTTGIISSITNLPGSYIAEIAIPWATFGVVPTAGSLLGMEVQINDDDTGFFRDAKLSWNDTADEAWLDPSVFGTLRLLANSAPTIGGTDTGSVIEDDDADSDDLLEFSGSLTITDADAGESVFVADTITGTYGDLTIDATGNWDYVADNTQAVIQQLDGGQSVNDTLTVTTADGTTHDVIITINGAEDAPVIGGIATGSVTEDGSSSDSNTLTITDVDANDNPISYNNVASTAGDNGYGNFAMAANIWTYTLNNSLAAVQSLGAGQSLTDTYTFFASDGSSQEVTITIDGTDDPSVIGGVAIGTVAEDTTLSASNSLTISDPDTPDNPSFNDVTPTLGDNGFGDFEITGNTWSYTLNNSLAAVQALGAGQSLTDTYTFFASDGSSQGVTITIDGSDDPSVIGGIATGSVSEDTSLTATNTLTITDVDTPDTPSFTNVAPALGDNGFGDFEITGNTWTYTLNNSLAAVQALGAGQTLTDTYTFLASDGSSQEVTITIDGTDDPSVIGGIATGSVSEDTTLMSATRLPSPMSIPRIPRALLMSHRRSETMATVISRSTSQYLDLYIEQQPGGGPGAWRRSDLDRHLYLSCQRWLEPGGDDHDRRHRRPLGDRRYCHRFSCRGYDSDGQQHAYHHRSGHPG